MNPRPILGSMFAIACSGSDPDGTGVVVNEFMASNSLDLQDETGAFPDWIEIWNGGPAAVDLGGWTVTDDLAEPQKWSLPVGTALDPGGYLVLFADGDVGDGPLHTNFKLDAELGEEIGLFDAGGATIDELVYAEQQADVSEARQPDGSPDWAGDPTPTPGRSNE